MRRQVLHDRPEVAHNQHVPEAKYLCNEMNRMFGSLYVQDWVPSP